MVTQEDSVSVAFTVSGIMILLYLSTIEGLTNLLYIPTVLLIFGVVLQLYTEHKIEHDISLEEHERRDIAIYTLLALVGMGVASIISRDIFIPPFGTVQLSLGDQLLYGTMFGISEEVFFRGGLLRFVLWRTSNSMLAIIGTASMFSIYHLGVYNKLPENMIYVFMAGIIFAFIVIKTKRRSPAILGHIGNNIMAIMGV